VRRSVIAGNWKMFKTTGEAVALARAIRSGLESAPANSEVMVAPPFTALKAVSEVLKGSLISLAGQNMHFEKEGAFTGEISPVMLRDVGCTHVILGHSERRHIFGEKDEDVARKVRAALDEGLTPVVCVGETLSERESRQTLEVVKVQMEHAFGDLTPAEAAKSLVAYEPVWAIGTGHAATPEQAQEVQAFIRKLVALSKGDPVADAVRILYGGSVKPENIFLLMAQGDIDGALVGAACLNPDSFLRIIHSA
jgi:triosephosphate isomerase (TIM)